MSEARATVVPWVAPEITPSAMAWNTTSYDPVWHIGNRRPPVVMLSAW